MSTPPRRAVIAGIGATEFSKSSGRSELRLAVEATKAALDDAGLSPAEVGGLVTFAMDTNPEVDVARNLGIPELTFFGRIEYGGGAACAVVADAAMAVEAGVADVVVCYRALNERSGRRFGAGNIEPPTRPVAAANRFSLYAPFGLITPASFIALFARRYMAEFGATSEDFGRVAVAGRAFAATNPLAWYHDRPITLEDHQASRFIVEPLHLLDCCQESDGAVAIVVTTAERAANLAKRPVLVEAAAQGSGADQESMTSFYRPSISGIPEMGLVARQLYARAGVSPADIQLAILYDHFSPFVLPQLEELGFCARGEARHFVADGHIGPGGSLPVNTNGGQLGEAYIHGLNGVAEAVRQLRGTAANQIAGVEHVVVTAGTGVPTSGLILGHTS